jgi:hypothetical protein
MHRVSCRNDGATPTQALSFHKEQPVGITTATFGSGRGAGTTSSVNSILRELI